MPVVLRQKAHKHKRRAVKAAQHKRIDKSAGSGNYSIFYAACYCLVYKYMQGVGYAGRSRVCYHRDAFAVFYFVYNAFRGGFFVKFMVAYKRLFYFPCVQQHNRSLVSSQLLNRLI